MQRYRWRFDQIWRQKGKYREFLDSVVSSFGLSELIFKSPTLLHCRWQSGPIGSQSDIPVTTHLIQIHVCQIWTQSGPNWHQNRTNLVLFRNVINKFLWKKLEKIRIIAPFKYFCLFFLFCLVTRYHYAQRSREISTYYSSYGYLNAFFLFQTWKFFIFLLGCHSFL